MCKGFIFILDIEVFLCCPIIWLYVLSPVLWCPLRFPHKTDVRFVFILNFGQSREAGNIGYTRRGQIKQKHNALCDGHHYTQTNTNNVNRIWSLQQRLSMFDCPFVLPVSLDCPCLIAPSCCQLLSIVHVWLPLRVASFSGLSMFDCPFVTKHLV
jgi:hypothetical protein